ncbi:hypothetical protein KDK77_00970 [bacterium]|nr:hypothetical protein [bacterium]MCP5462032.1 hypothetical protein [bacterium]
MLGPKIKITKELLEKVKLAAELSGCSSTDEFIANVLEREADKINNQAKKQQAEDSAVIKNRLKGLGYID